MMLRSLQSLAERFNNYQMKTYATSRNVKSIPAAVQWVKLLYYVFFWVVPWRLNYICRRFGTHYLFHLRRQVVNLPMKKEQIAFRNVGIYNSGAWKLPKRKHNVFRTRRKFEIKNSQNFLSSYKISGLLTLKLVTNSWAQFALTVLGQRKSNLYLLMTTNRCVSVTGRNFGRVWWEGIASSSSMLCSIRLEAYKNLTLSLLHTEHLTYGDWWKMTVAAIQIYSLSPRG